MVDATLAGQVQVPAQPVDVHGEVRVLPAVEQDDGHPVAVLGLQLGVGVDVDELGREPRLRSDPRTGSAVRAVVVLAAGEELTFEELQAHAAESLARYKVPTSVNFLPALPHSLTGKVSRARLRELGLTGDVEVLEAAGD